MTRTIIQMFVLAIVLVLAQVVCNKIILFNVAMPIVFIYLILRMPMSWHPNITMTVGFVVGLIVDIFNNTPGMNALSCTVLAGVRHAVFNAYVPREDEMTDPIPSIESLGIAVYFKYMFTLVLLYCTLLFFIQAFTLRNVLLTLARIAASTLLTTIILLGVDSLVSTRREKGL